MAVKAHDGKTRPLVETNTAGTAHAQVTSVLVDGPDGAHSIGTAHPVPVQLQAGGTLAEGTPLPTQLQVGTTPVSDTAPVPAKKVVRPTTPVSHRAGKTGRDVLAVPTTGGQPGAIPGGSLSADTYYNLAIVAGNPAGRTTAFVVVPYFYNSAEPPIQYPHGAIPQVASATFYDLYFSVDADPLWVGRITEAQRVAGCSITAVGVVGAGTAAGYVDIQVVGTGRAASTAAKNTAYVVPADLVDCTGYEWAHFDVTMALPGDVDAPSLTLTPFLKNTRDTSWYADTPVVMDFGGAVGHLNSLKQRLNVRVFGNAAVALLIQDIGGTGASVSMDVSLS